MRNRANANPLAVTAIIAAIILYGSLYPFAFHPAEHGTGAFAALLATGGNPPKRGDFLANMLLYAPLGFFGVMSLGNRLGGLGRVLVVVVAAALFSFAIEMLQYYDGFRNTSALDIYANVLGAALGAFAGVLFGGRLRWGFVGDAIEQPFPALILAAWVGYRLFPFVPVIDLHKYWNAVKPIFLQPSLTSYDLFRHTVSWLTVCALLEALSGQNRSLRAFPLFAFMVLMAKVLIIDKFVVMAEIVGAVLAFALWLLLINRSERFRATLIAVLLCVSVISWRLAPFEFAVRARGFGWVPFLDLMRGSIMVNVASFLEKVFYYGALIWLITVAGARLRTAAIGVALLLLVMSLAEMHLPGRSASLTDGVIALVVAMIVALLRPAEVPVKSRAAYRRNG